MQPQWIKDLIKNQGQTASVPGRKPVAEQYTVVRKVAPVSMNSGIRPMAMGSESQQPSQQPLSPQPLSRMTGSGMDNQIQPNKMTGQVHEGEGVLNVNAMQNLEPDEFTAFSKALESGALDKNTFRRAIGLQPVAGFATGGLVKLDNIQSQAPTVAPMTATPTMRQPQAPTAPVAPIAAPVSAPKPIAQTPVAAPITVAPNPKIATPSAAPVAPVTVQNTPSQAPQQTTVTATPTQRVNPTPTPTPLAINNAPAPNDRSTYYNDLFTNATGKDYRGTAAMAQENYDNSAMQSSGAASAAAAAAAAQELNQAGVSAAGKATQSAELARTQSNSADTLRGQLANQFTNNLSNFSNIDIAQRQQGMNEKQKAIDNARYDQESATAANQTAYNRTRDALSDTNAEKTDAQKTMEERFGMLFNGGTTLENAKNDPTLQNLVKSYLGADATPEQINSEIAMMFNSATTNNLDSFNANTEKFIGAAIDNKKSIEEVLNDQNIRRNVSGYLGPNATPADIDKEISTIFNELNKSDAERIFDNFSENWVSEDIKSVPGWDTDLRQTISDLYLKGVVDADGNVKEGAVFEWPWEDPDTIFRYQDWNGKAATGGTYDQNQTINLDGNGTKFINATGGAVTMADANSKWNTLSSSDRSSFMKNGTMDTAAFMAKYFPTTKGADGNVVPLTTRNDFTNKVISDPTYLDTVDTVLKEFQSGGSYPGKPGEDSTKPNAGQPIPAGRYIYYDANGDAQVAGKSEGNRLAYIYQQLSDKYGKGTPLTAGQFQEYWQDGKQWRIGDDGTILNIDNPGGKIKTEDNPVVKSFTLSEVVEPTAKLSDQQLSSFKNLSEDEVKSSELFANSNPGNGVQGYKGAYVLEESDGYDNRDKNMRADLEKWVNTNKGKLYRTKGGEVFQIMGAMGGWTYMRNMETNEVYSTKQGVERYNEGSATDSKWSSMFTSMKPDPQVVDVSRNKTLTNTNSR